MDVRGERILIFGDSLTHHGSDSGPEIWDVGAPSDRSSSAPGDLLASMLLEQGAAAVRTNANVSRSAANFWRGNSRFQRRSAIDLIADDQAFKPTKVIVMLGTNDADSGAIDAASMKAIRDTYASMGAEVWAIGPPVFTSTALNTKVDQVYVMMADVFGKRLIDARPLSTKEGRANDGVHFKPPSAHALALQLANVVMTTATKSWVMTVLGVAALGTLSYLIWRNIRSGAPKTGIAGGKTPLTIKLNAESARITQEWKDTYQNKMYAGDLSMEDWDRSREERDARIDAIDDVLIPLMFPKPKKGSVERAQKLAKSLGLKGLGMRWTGDVSMEDVEKQMMRVQMRVGENELIDIDAVAVLNDWAATPSDKVKGKFAVTHLPTGLSTGPAMTKLQAMRTVGKLRDVNVRSGAELLAKIGEVRDAHPKAMRAYFNRIIHRPTDKFDAFVIPEDDRLAGSLL